MFIGPSWSPRVVNQAARRADICPTWRREPGHVVKRGNLLNQKVVIKNYGLVQNMNSPNMSDEMGVLKMSPVNSQVVCLASIPLVPSNT